MCRIGFFGAGGVAARHARMLTGFGPVRLVSVTDLDPERAEAFAGEYGLKAVPGITELIDSGVDAIYVCVPPFAHGPVERAASAAGVAVFVEKPIGLDLASAELIEAELRDSGVVTAVGHHWRYSTVVARARRLLRGQSIRLALGAWLDKVPPVPWWACRTRSGGQVLEQAIHVLDLTRLLVGEIVEVHAMANSAPPHAPDADVDGATVVNLRFADGAVGSLSATCLLGWKHRAGLEVYADGLAVTVTEEALEVRDASGTRTWRCDPDDAKRAADEAFVEAVLGHGDDVRCSYREALRTHELACAVTRSLALGDPVRVGAERDVAR